MVLHGKVMNTGIVAIEVRSNSFFRAERVLVLLCCLLGLLGAFDQLRTLARSNECRHQPQLEHTDLLL